MTPSALYIFVCISFFWKLLVECLGLKESQDHQGRPLLSAALRAAINGTHARGHHITLLQWLQPSYEYVCRNTPSLWYYNKEMTPKDLYSFKMCKLLQQIFVVFESTVIYDSLPDGRGVLTNYMIQHQLTSVKGCGWNSVSRQVCSETDTNTVNTAAPLTTRD